MLPRTRCLTSGRQLVWTSPIRPLSGSASLVSLMPASPLPWLIQPSSPDIDVVEKAHVDVAEMLYSHLDIVMCTPATLLGATYRPAIDALSHFRLTSPGVIMARRIGSNSALPLKPLPFPMPSRSSYLPSC